jgi:hypothetical protein
VIVADQVEPTVQHEALALEVSGDIGEQRLPRVEFDVRALDIDPVEPRYDTFAAFQHRQLGTLHVDL